MTERVLRLEEKMAYLERHITQQDKVVLELNDALERLRLEVRVLRERLAGVTNPGDDDTPPEKPPHY
jgi:SlyX protein